MLFMFRHIYLFSPLLVIIVSSEFVNIAYKRPTWQKTTHPSKFGPEKAVDGLKTDLSAGGHQCSISDNEKRIASWRVNLLDRKFIHHIVIYYRTDNNAWGENNSLAGRFLGFSIYISSTENKDDGTLCFHDTEYNMTSIPAVVNITCQLYGQYVIYYNERINNSVYPVGYSKYAFNELCEVEVYGCALGYYGRNCSLLCPEHCQNCNTETGACLWCNVGYTGKDCEIICFLGKFGANCTGACGECAGNCDHKYGNCSRGCLAGFKGNMCNELCEFGKFGENCNQRCGMCVETCFHVNGTCLRGCQSGYQGDLCNEECGHGRFGSGCEEFCGKCDGECDHVNGRCYNACRPGYKGLLCKSECPSGSYGTNCSERCGECLGNCNGIDGHCPRGCKAGYMSGICKEACSLGKFGVNCSGMCGECSGRCNNIDGDCAWGCKAGYHGKTCHDVCDFGFFGIKCQHECSMFCSISRNCSRISGECMNGCKGGWGGLDCLEMKNHDAYRKFGSIETVELLAISLSICMCLMFAYCIKRYVGEQRRKQQKVHRNSFRNDFVSASVQTESGSLENEDYSEREYNELQFLHIDTESDYYNM